MMDDNFLYFKTAIILVLKKLRKLKGVSQDVFNFDFEQMTGFTHNMGRTETDANFTMETFYIYCKYFNISAVKFFEMVSEVTQEDVKLFLEKKEEERRKKEERKKKKL